MPDSFFDSLKNAYRSRTHGMFDGTVPPEAVNNALSVSTQTVYGGNGARAAYDSNDIASPDNRKRMIGMRLWLPNGYSWSFDFLETHWHGEKVFVFVATGEQYVVLEDQAALFPSDTLITQLRLIQK
jgi:hypothetical protein